MRDARPSGLSRVGRATGAVVRGAAVLAVLAQRAMSQDTSSVQGGVYNRPVVVSAGRTSLGGYVEGHGSYAVADGASEGLQMELRRFNLFVFSSLGPRLRFFAELEFEDGAREIALETAQVDMQINTALSLRGGILLVPLGAFNQGHDSPRWDFIERPLVSTRLIPGTLSEMGVGLFGRWVRGPFSVTYDAYLTNGLQDGVTLNGEGRTLISAGKGPGMVAEDNNGEPATSGRMAARWRNVGELGVSQYAAVYNAWRVEGVAVDGRRSVRISAVDWSTRLWRAEVRGEAAWAQIDLPPGAGDELGSRQVGAFTDVMVPVWRPRSSTWRDAVVSVALRAEFVDFNDGRFASTGGSIGDEVRALVLGATFRPTAGTVFKLNYRREWRVDLVGRTSWVGAIQAGLATYF